MDTITAQELKRRIDAGESLHIIDVREPDEVAESRIEGSTHIPLGEIMSFQLGELEDLEKDTELIMQCRSGKRSLQAGMMLQTMGFTNVKNMAGGILDWQALNGK
jgi:rhodanese-related sulfurtransferase